MQKKTRTIALTGVGVATAVALGVGGATLATAAGETTATPATSTTSTTAPSQGSNGGSADTLPGGGVPSQGGGSGVRPDGEVPGGMRDDGGTLTAAAASKAVTAAEAKVSGGTASSVRATSTGSYVVDVLKSDGTQVHVVLDARFAVTSVETGGMGGPGGPPPSGTGTGTGSGSGSTSPSDANGTSSSST